jgi:sorbose reductase
MAGTDDAQILHDNMKVLGSDRVLPLFSLQGRTAIVSGGGAGIGLAVAHALAEAGANVAIWYNSNTQAVKEAKKIKEIYGVKCESTRQFVPHPRTHELTNDMYLFRHRVSSQCPHAYSRRRSCRRHCPRL